MSDFNTSKIDGNTVGSVEWNQLADVDNLVINSGQTPSTSNLNQLAIASARYSSGGRFFIDSGAANAYVLAPVSPFKSPVSSGAGEGYFNGMIIIFRAGNANSGASTINVNSAGVKNLKKADGTDVATGDILTTRDVTFRYDGTNFIKLENLNPATAATAGIQTITPPIGSIQMWAGFNLGAIAPNWLHCDGSTISRTTYANLWNAIGSTWGSGDGSTTFVIPDFRGLFPRGYDSGRGIDSGRTMNNNWQDYSIQSHNHIVGGSQEAIAGGSAVRYSLVNAPGSFSFGSGHTGSAETRPRNLATWFLIKFA